MRAFNARAMHHSGPKKPSLLSFQVKRSAAKWNRGLSIDVAQVNRLLDEARVLSAESLQEAYRALPNPPSACTECGACTPRCPFGVDVVARMRETVATFDGARVSGTV